MAKAKKKKTTPMLEQWWAFKKQHEDKILLFRMGDFYETFFEDAKITARVLGITLTTRGKSEDSPVPLAGFPYHALDIYLNKLVQAGKKVVICEQVEDPKDAVGIVKRDIVDIITPGSIIDSNLINKSENNFLAGVYFAKKNKVGLSFIDISTGDFLFTEIKEDQLQNELTRLSAVEIVVKDETSREKLLSYNLENSPLISYFDSWRNDSKECIKTLKSQFHTKSLESIGANKRKDGAIAAGLVLSYVEELKNCDLLYITSLVYYSLEDCMLLDEISRRNLELTKSLRYGNKYGTLLSALDNTKTAMGSRLLNSWLVHPLIEKKKITERLSAVQQFKDKIEETNSIRDILDTIGDLSRVISKIGAQKVMPKELLGLRNYLVAAPKLYSHLQLFDSTLIKDIVSQISDYSHIINLIDSAILDNPQNTIKDGNVINTGYNEELDNLREISKDGKSWIARLESSEKEKTGINSLKIGYNRVFGYYIEVTKIHLDKIPEEYIRKQTLTNSERFISPVLKEYEAKVLGAEERIKSLEYELFKDIRLKMQEEIESMQKFVNVVSLIDVLSTLGLNAHKNNYVMPQFSDSENLELDECRHPVIEQLLKDEVYIPNDVALNDIDNQIAIITGPNMAGKSTYLRQIGLISIMAQIGSFVPAKKAILPIFDKVFTRVGASDNLAQGQSTFLVEMIETANILNSATSKSLILLDEIGRGTSTFDGLSLAWAIVEYINKYKKAKTLFATHYHELTELENVLSKVKNYNISVKEYNDEMIFLRKVARGGADQSYGIQVARLAGMPTKVLGRAKQILSNLEKHELSPQGLTHKIKQQLNQLDDQINIFETIVEENEDNQEFINEIMNFDLDSMSPIEAWQALKSLQDKIDK